MRDGMTRVATYGSELEAEMALGRLQALGIEGCLEMDNCGGQRPHMDVANGVCILVYPEDAAHAKAVLEGHGGDGSGAWQCPACGEDGEPGFDACWNCGRERM